MAEKIALQGFSRVTFFPIIKNDTTSYEVGAGFEMPNAQEMTKDADVSENKIYADDVLYLDMKSWNGLKSNITLAEMSLEMMAKLGFGEHDSLTDTLKWNPQGKNNEYGVTFRCLRADGNYRMYKMYVFTVSEIVESGTKTKGDGGEINTYQVSGTFTARKSDDNVADIKDSKSIADFAWLNSIETV